MSNRIEIFKRNSLLEENNKRGKMKKSLLIILILFFVSLAVLARSDFGVMSTIDDSILQPNETYEFQIKQYNLTVINAPTGINDNPICRVEFYVRNSTITYVPDKNNWNEFIFYSSDYDEIVWNRTTDCIPVGSSDSFIFNLQADEVNSNYSSQWILVTPGISDTHAFNVLIMNDSLEPRLIDWTARDEGIFLKNGHSQDFFINFVENESGINETKSKLKYDYQTGCVWTDASFESNLQCDSSFCNSSDTFTNVSASYVGFRFDLWDNAGNLNSTEYYDGTWDVLNQNLNYIYLDNDNASLALSSPSQNNITNNPIVVFLFDVNDSSFYANNAGGCAGKFNPELYCNLTLNGTIYNQKTATSAGTYNFTENLSDSIYQWSITCQDKAGWQNTSETRTLIVDTQAPKVDLITPTNASYQLSDLTFYWNATDNIDTNISCSLTIDGSVNQTLFSYGIFSVDVTSLADGQHLWNVTCQDDAGNSNTSETRIFWVDTTAPTITLNLPADSSTFNLTGSSLTITFNFTAVDNMASSMGCNLVANSSTINTTTANNNTLTDIQGTFADDGTYNWKVTCQDGAGNSNVSETRTFTIVDIGLPQGDHIEPLNGATLTTSSIAIKANATDNLELANATLYIWKGNVTKYTDTKSLSGNDTEVSWTKSLANADYKWSVLIYDAAGNFAWLSDGNWTFTVDKSSGGGSSRGGSSCSSECSFGQKECINESYYHTCGDYDADSCYEWSLPVFCENGCVNGSCIGLGTSCVPDWKCTDWSDCKDGKQTRSCDDKNDCGTKEGRPTEEQTCKTTDSEETGTEESTESESPSSGPGITGRVIGALGKPAAIGTIIGIIAIVAALSLMINLRKRKKGTITKEIGNILVDKESEELKSDS